MAFVQNELAITSPDQRVQLRLSTGAALGSISRTPPTEIRLPDAANAFWQQRGAALGCHQSYDWTFWAGSYCGSVSRAGAIASESDWLPVCARAALAAAAMRG